jgi:NTE family protein
MKSPLQPTLLHRLLGDHSKAQSRGFVFSELLTRLFLPFEFNPLNQNPLRQVLLDSVDFAALSPTTCPIKLYLAATNVRTRKIKVFGDAEIGVEVVLASACLPFLFRAVEIDGEAYWDGGHAGNPPIFPLIYNCSSSDVLIVQLSPMRREELPQSATEILNRVNEISFNSSWFCHRHLHRRTPRSRPPAGSVSHLRPRSCGDSVSKCSRRPPATLGRLAARRPPPSTCGRDQAW